MERNLKELGFTDRDIKVLIKKANNKSKVIVAGALSSGKSTLIKALNGVERYEFSSVVSRTEEFNELNETNWKYATLEATSFSIAKNFLAKIDKYVTYDLIFISLIDGKPKIEEMGE